MNKVETTKRFQKLVEAMLSTKTINKRDLAVMTDITAMTLNKILNWDGYGDLHIRDTTVRKMDKFITDNMKYFPNSDTGKVTDEELDEAVKNAKRLLDETGEPQLIRKVEPSSEKTISDFWDAFAQAGRSVPNNVQITIRINEKD